MSTDERLERLGLLHLRDKPEELKRALQKIVDEEQKVVDAAKAKIEQKRRDWEARQKAKADADGKAADGGKAGPDKPC